MNKKEVATKKNLIKLLDLLDNIPCISAEAQNYFIMDMSLEMLIKSI